MHQEKYVLKMKAQGCFFSKYEIYSSFHSCHTFRYSFLSNLVKHLSQAPINFPIIKIFKQIAFLILQNKASAITVRCKLDRRCCAKCI